MKKLLVSAMVACCMMVVIASAHAAQAGKSEAKPAKPAMSKFLIISPHTEEECLQTLDNVKAMGPNALSKWDFGCKDGDHTGYMIVMASSSEEALKNVPESVRDKAKAVKVHRFTAAELKSIHEKMKS
ncbi:MAG: hypothetical protein DMD82_06560 [Candidatus Rokuibacteriota bacterium]|nr:MAG: hypothetical protein DMD82_06560 [Candidatus Rokubacteria bacterium]